MLLPVTLKIQISALGQYIFHTRFSDFWLANLYMYTCWKIFDVSYILYHGNFWHSDALYALRVFCMGNHRSLVVPFRVSNQTVVHYDDVIMSTIASQITSPTIVYSTIYSGADQSKHQSSASLAFVWGIHRGPVNSPHKWPVTRKMFPFDDVIMDFCIFLAWTSFPRDIWVFGKRRNFHEISA